MDVNNTNKYLFLPLSHALTDIKLSVPNEGAGLKVNTVFGIMLDLSSIIFASFIDTLVYFSDFLMGLLLCQ